MDERDCFDRLLEWIEDLVKENARISDQHMHEQSARREAERKAERLESVNRYLARLERFVESTPERQADWVNYITPKPAKDGEDIPF